MKQVIFGGEYAVIIKTGTRWNYVQGGDSSWSAVEISTRQVVSTGGVLKNLRVKLDGVPGTGTYTFTLRLDTGGGLGDTTLTCTVAADGTVASDTVHEVTVAAGDIITLQCEPSAAPAPDDQPHALWSLVFDGSTANESLILGGTVIAVLAGTNYNGIMVGFSSFWGAEAERRQVCACNGVIKNLHVVLSEDPGTAPDAYHFKLRVGDAAGTMADSDDGAGNPLEVEIVADNVSGSDTTHEIPVTAGQVLSLECEAISGPSATPTAAWGCTFVATTDGESPIISGTRDESGIGAAEFINILSSRNQAFSTEIGTNMLGQSCVLKDLYVLVLTAPPGGGETFIFTLRVEGASSTLTTTITNPNKSNSDTTHDVAVGDGEVVALMSDATGSSGSCGDTYWGLVCYIEPEGWANIAKANGVMAAAIAKVNGVDVANIAKMKGVAV